MRGGIGSYGRQGENERRGGVRRERKGEKGELPSSLFGGTPLKLLILIFFIIL